LISADLYVLNGLMNKTTATHIPSTQFVRTTRFLGYVRVWSSANEEQVIELARAAAPIGWIADSGAFYSDLNGCWIVDFELGDRS